MVDKNIYIVQGEIGVLVGAIKRNARWSMHTPLDEEQDPLLHSFSQLKDILNNIKHLSEIEPNVFLRPFLEVIRSEDTTGPITGLALTSVNKFLSYALIDPVHDGTAEGIENMADAVTHARFVGTDPASDEVVLMKILQVLRTLLLTPVGAHLTNESVCEIMQSCFRICFEMRLSELLRKSAEHTLVDMVQLLFSRSWDVDFYMVSSSQLKMRAGGASDSSKWKKQKRSPRPPRHVTKAMAGADSTPQPLSNGSSAGGIPFMEPSSPDATSPISGVSSEPTSSAVTPTADSGIGFSSQATSKEDLSEMDSVAAALQSSGELYPSDTQNPEEQKNEESLQRKTQSASVESIPEVLEDHSDSASVHDMDYVNPRGVRFTPQSSQKEGAVLVPYGLPCIRELFRFLISLTNPHDRHNSEVMIHMGLQLITVALECAPIANYGSLLGLVKDELCRHLFQLLSGERLNLYAASLRACFLLFESMREHLKFQLEMYIKKLMDIITIENPKMPYEMKEMALEAIVQLWRIPSLVTELYINYDCDYYCSNLFEDLTKLLSKNAFPVSGQLYTTHLLSLEALLTVIDSTEAHCQAKILSNTLQQDKKEMLKNIADCTEVTEDPGNSTEHLMEAASPNFSTESQGARPPTSGHLMADKMSLGVQEAEDGSDRVDKKTQKKPPRFSTFLPTVQELNEIKTKKKLLITGTEQFNQKSKKGIQFLQEKNLMATPMDNKEVAQWLRENPRLDKKMIGEFISDRKSMDLLESFVGNEEIVMPEEQTGLVKENYMWNVLLHRGATPEGLFLHVTPGSYDHDLFTMTWGPTIAALSYVFDKSMEESIIQKAISGFRKCAMISAHYGLSDVFDNLIISLCKFTTLSSEAVENLPTVFGSNPKAQIAAKTVFHLAHRHGDILREGWKNIMDSMLQLFRAELLPKAMVEVEDYVDPNGKISLQREEIPANRGESTVLSFVSWLTLSGTEQSSLRGPSTENQEAKKMALECIKLCDPEKLITESKFLQLESLQELMKALISVTPDEETYDEEDAAFCLEMLLRIVLENRDRVGCVWQVVRDHLYHLCAHAMEFCFLVERAVVGLLRLAIRLLRREDISAQVLLSLRILLMMKPSVLSRVSRQVAFGLHELLKTNAANIHSSNDWYTLFSLLECIGAGVKPPPALQVTTRSDNDAGAQSDSEVSSYHATDVSLDRGYTSDSEIYAEHSKQSKMHRSVTNVDMVNSGWLVVAKEDVDSSKVTAAINKPGTNAPVNQYSLTIGLDFGPHDTKSLMKSVESLSFIVRDAAHVTPENFELCVKTIRVFVEASLNGGYKSQEKRAKSHKYDSKSNRFKKKSKEKEIPIRRSRISSQRQYRSHSDDEDDESVPASYHTVSLQVSHDLLDLMHTLHTRAATIYSSWAEEQRHLETAGEKITADSRTLWSNCWCPLLQGIAWLCCDARRQVRMQALTYLQRALLVHDLQTLDALEWEACFNKVLFPLLTKLLENISPADVGGMEETRMRASTLLSKVFLQHLSPLLSLSTFAALWLTILDFMDKYMHAGSSDLLMEAIPESFKNMLLVMDTAGIFHSADSRTGYSDLWEITWERIDCFLPHLREELFKQTVIQDPPHVATTEPVPQKTLCAPTIVPVASESKPVTQTAQPERIMEQVHSDSDSTGPGLTTVPGSSPTCTPLRMSPVTEVPAPMAQSPLILHTLTSPLQVGVPPMSLPIILNPALIEATSPVPLLSTPRPAEPSPVSEVN
ncbi:hypothetical protein GDO81_004410 [Engystomops pustulosus]|uniref:SEC7 domain-containing protein n=1 Tax=Engystomops pustulosus TaxID=76066 RepID=A0AAV6ZXV3_ENGPU|nr:hypothetical protein GDO81_004410 [Engystomops pustulosus]